MIQKAMDGGPNEALKAFRYRFVELMSEAKSYGIASVVCLSTTDPMIEQEIATYDHAGGHLVCYAMCLKMSDKLRFIGEDVTL